MEIPTMHILSLLIGCVGFSVVSGKLENQFLLHYKATYSPEEALRQRERDLNERESMILVF
jgi:hypothetical protein